MVFGGVVHERLQLNEDTLWAGRPYDPVNPDAKAALPEVRRLLTESRYGDAAALASKSVMAKPLAQMPYQTLGDLGLTFDAVDVVERYRRDLDLSTATAHVSYTTGGVTFDREVFASAPDQVIVVRLTASRPGQISFEARLHTPQRATVEATTDGDLVMRGVNGDGRGATADGQAMTGALRFESRVRVLTTGGTRTAAGDAIVVRGADAATLLIAAATSYRRYDDVSGDPAAAVAAALGAAAGKTVEALRARTSVITGSSSTASRSTSARRRGRPFPSTSASQRSRPAAIRHWPRSTSSTGVTCSSPARAPARNPPTSRGSGTTACRRPGEASTPSTSTPR